MIWDQGNKVGH